MQTKNILIVTSEFPPQPGGIGNHAYNLAFHLSKNAYKVTVIADQRGDKKEVEMAFDSALPFDVQRIRMRKMRLIMYLERISKTSKALKDADVVIATGKFSLWNVALCTRFIKCTSLAIIHGSEVNFKSFFNKLLVEVSLKQFDTIIAVSNFTKRLVAHLNLSVEVIPNGIDVGQWKYQESFDVDLEGYPVLTTVGRLSNRKGQLNVIRMLPELLQVFPEIHYHCVGIPSEAEAFLAVAKSLDVDHHVKFHGVLEDRALKNVLGKTDVFLMLSQESNTGDVEGFGIAILEANAMGVPAIGARGCGIEDAIKNGDTGFLIDATDAHDLIDGIEYILKRRELFSDNAKSWARRHDWEHLIKLYISLM